MKKILLLFILLPLFVCVYAQNDSFIQKGKEVLQQLQKGQGAIAHQQLDQYMKSQISAIQLNQLFGALQQQVGTYEKATNWQATSSNEFIKVTARLNFKFADLQYIVSFAQDGKINGLWFKPLPKKKKEETAKTSAFFTEKEMKLISGHYHLPAKLTLPKEKPPIAYVILLQGSGPQDMDETLFENKPLRDIAHGLAQQGIASFRYDKRTYCYANQFVKQSQYTTREEVTEDAIAAFKKLQKMTALNRKPCFFLGHSLGGMLLPRILTECHAAKGGIVLAGVATNLADLILKQMIYLNRLNGSKQNEKIKALKVQVENVKKINTSQYNKNIPLPLDLPRSYWKDLMGYQPTKTAQQLQQPLLFLNGERDYQVSLSEFNAWKKALRTKKKVQFISYPLLNHLFMQGSNPATPKDYLKKSTVDAKVITDIAHWIREQILLKL